MVVGEGVAIAVIERQHADARRARLPAARPRPSASVLNFEGSFRYPGSTEGLPFTMGLRLCATQPDSPWPTGISQGREQTVIFAVHVFRESSTSSRWIQMARA